MCCLYVVSGCPAVPALSGKMPLKLVFHGMAEIQVNISAKIIIFSDTSKSWCVFLLLWPCFSAFGLAGAVASLFACCAFCCDLAGKSKKSLCSLSYVPFTLLLAWGAVRSGVMAQMERGCTSANYYEWTLEMPVFHHISWFT